MRTLPSPLEQRKAEPTTEIDMDLTPLHLTPLGLFHTIASVTASRLA